MTRRFSVASFFNQFLSRTNIWSLGIIVISSLSYYFLFDFLRWNQFDSASYEAGSRLLFGLEGGADIQGRMSKPLVLILPGFFEFTFGLAPKYSFLIQSGICYIILVFLWKGILRNLEFSETIQKIGTLMLVLSQPVAVFSFGILTDFPGWCCMLWLIYIYTRKSKSMKWLQICIVTLIGLLVKESIFVGIIFIAVSVLLDKTILLKKKMIYGFFFLLTILLSQFIILQLEFGGLIKRQSEIMQWGSLFDQHSYSELFQIWRAFDGTWWLFILALFSLKSQLKKSPYLLESLITLIASFIFLPFAHPASMVDRILFMFFPMVFIISLTYLQKFPKRIMLFMILFNGLLAISTAFIIYKMDMKGTYVVSFLFSLLIPVLLIFNGRGLFRKITN
jgi:hypothetical protein